MIDLNKYYISSTFQGVSGAQESRSGFVPQALSGDEQKFLRGDGTWQNVSVVSTVQYLQTSSTINLNIEEYDTFVVNVTDSITFTYSNFPLGKSINVYLSANHNNYISHTFPENTIFAELGDENTIYSFSGYTTRILLQNVGAFVINFSSISKNPSAPPYYYGGGDGGGIGIELLELY